MGQIQASIVLDCDAATAARAWEEFDFEQGVIPERGPAAGVGEAIEDDAAEEQVVTFEERDGTTLFVLTLVYDEDAEGGTDVSTLRADVDDELGRFREFVESGES
jgi:hypothetical protein